MLYGYSLYVSNVPTFCTEFAVVVLNYLATHLAICFSGYRVVPHWGQL